MCLLSSAQFSGWECGSGVEHSLSMHEALVLIPSILKKSKYIESIYRENCVMCMYIYTYMYIKQFLFLFLFKREVLLCILSWPWTPYVVQATLEHMTILLPQPPDCWNYRLELLCTAKIDFWKRVSLCNSGSPQIQDPLPRSLRCWN